MSFEDSRPRSFRFHRDGTEDSSLLRRIQSKSEPFSEPVVPVRDGSSPLLPKSTPRGQHAASYKAPLGEERITWRLLLHEYKVFV